MADLRLPTKAQIDAIADVAALTVLADDIERETAKITAQLEVLQDDADPEWAIRAANALGIFRYTGRVVQRRLDILNQDIKARTALRPEGDCHPLTQAAIRARPAVDPEALDTPARVDAAMADIVAMLNAVRDDREDEIARPAIERDEGFLAASGSLVRHLSGLRQALQIRRGVLNRAERQRVHQAEQATRERAFIEAAKAILTGETFAAIWARVDRAGAEAGERAA